jgi:phenylalanyl-tRNA synthetase beta subunit
MLISYKWLERYFDEKLPEAEKISSALTMHSFEVESFEVVEGDVVFNIKVLPNRTHDCLSHRGIAREISVILGIGLNKGEYELKPLSGVPESNKVTPNSVDQKICPRFSALVIENVKIKESPKWLRELLKSIGQKSINNVVDITNYVMFSMGQPLHAYDLSRLNQKDGIINFGVRMSRKGEKLLTLDGKEYKMPKESLVIENERAVGIAGVKGGNSSRIDENTKSIVIEAANFNPVAVRKSSKAIGLRTDASIRFENDISPKLTLRALEMARGLVLELASTKDTIIEGFADFYPIRRSDYKVGVSLEEIKKITGIDFDDKEIKKILDQALLKYEMMNPRDIVLSLAKENLGKPYKYGASVTADAPNAFDCSSFVSWLYAQAGISIPRISIDQYIYGAEISREEAKPGDLVFSNTHNDVNGIFHTKSSEFMPGTVVEKPIDHCGLFIGEGKVIHATKSKGMVVEELLAESEQFRDITGFRRMTEKNENRYVVTVPFERLDFKQPADLIEEIARIYGYENIKTKKIDDTKGEVFVDKETYYANKVRDILIDGGFSEVMSYAFRSSGEVEILNPIASNKDFLRQNLKESIKELLEFNFGNSELLGLESVRIFEMGTVFNNAREYTSLAIGIKANKKQKETGEQVAEIIKKIDEKLGSNLAAAGKIGDGIYEGDFERAVKELAKPDEVSEFQSDKNVKFNNFSAFPFVLRDIAIFAPTNVTADEIYLLIKKEAGELLVRTRLFDVFEKTTEDGEKKTSYAFRLVFQSKDRTLTDEKVNEIMNSVIKKINEKTNWQVR